MTTVAEIKENLLQDRLALAEVAQMSIASIDTVVKAYEADQNRERVRSKVVIMDDPPNAAFAEREFSDG